MKKNKLDRRGRPRHPLGSANDIREELRIQGPLKVLGAHFGALLPGSSQNWEDNSWSCRRFNITVFTITENITNMNILYAFFSDFVYFSKLKLSTISNGNKQTTTSTNDSQINYTVPPAYVVFLVVSVCLFRPPLPDLSKLVKLGPRDLSANERLAFDWKAFLFVWQSALKEESTKRGVITVHYNDNDDRPGADPGFTGGGSTNSLGERQHTILPNFPN